MRIQKIVCDRCGKEIAGNPVQIMPGYVDRKTGDLWPDNNNPLPDWAEKILGKDFCVECTEKIVRYANGRLKVNPEFEQAVEEMVSNGTQKKKETVESVSMVQIDGSEEIVKDALPKEKPAGRQKLDTGKILALTKAGWSVKKIADEMGVNTQAIYDARYRLKKEGKL